MILSEKSSEFSRLNPTDQLLCLHTLEVQSTELEFVVNDLVRPYNQSGVVINPVTLIDELRRFEAFCNASDQWVPSDSD